MYSHTFLPGLSIWPFSERRGTEILFSRTLDVITWKQDWEATPNVPAEFFQEWRGFKYAQKISESRHAPVLKLVLHTHRNEGLRRELELTHNFDCRLRFASDGPTPYLCLKKKQKKLERSFNAIVASVTDFSCFSIFGMRKRKLVKKKIETIEMVQFVIYVWIRVKTTRIWKI